MIHHKRVTGHEQLEQPSQPSVGCRSAGQSAGRRYVQIVEIYPGFKTKKRKKGECCAERRCFVVVALNRTFYGVISRNCWVDPRPSFLHLSRICMRSKWAWPALILSFFQFFFNFCLLGPVSSAAYAVLYLGSCGFCALCPLSIRPSDECCPRRQARRARASPPVARSVCQHIPTDDILSITFTGSLTSSPQNQAHRLSSPSPIVFRRMCITGSTDRKNVSLLLTTSPLVEKTKVRVPNLLRHTT